MNPDTKDVLTDKVKAQMETLLKEYLTERKVSGLGMDEFMKKKLSELRDDGEKCTGAMLEILNGIDTNYKDLSEKLENGMSRSAWLGDRIKTIANEGGAGGKPEVVGEALAMATDVLNGNKEGTTEPLPFENGDVSEITQGLEKAIARRVHSNLTAEGKKEI